MTEPRLKSTTSPEITANPEFAKLAADSTEILQGFAGAGGVIYHADWSCKTDDQQRQLIVLTLRRDSTAVTDEFAPHDLNAPFNRMYDLWGKLQSNLNK